MRSAQINGNGEPSHEQTPKADSQKGARRRGKGLACAALLWGVFNAISEIQLQSQLHDARIVRGCDLAETGGNEASGNSRIIRVVEQVESLRAELQVHVFAAQFAVFEKRKVPALEARTGHHAPSGVAGTIGVKRCRHKGRRVEERRYCVLCASFGLPIMSGRALDAIAPNSPRPPGSVFNVVTVSSVPV
jgi:hypothetical protein